MNSSNDLAAVPSTADLLAAKDRQIDRLKFAILNLKGQMTRLRERLAESTRKHQDSRTKAIAHVEHWKIQHANAERRIADLEKAVMDKRRQLRELESACGVTYAELSNLDDPTPIGVLAPAVLLRHGIVSDIVSTEFRNAVPPSFRKQMDELVAAERQRQEEDKPF